MIPIAIAVGRAGYARARGLVRRKGSSLGEEILLEGRVQAGDGPVVGFVVEGTCAGSTCTPQVLPAPVTKPLASASCATCSALL